MSSDEKVSGLLMRWEELKEEGKTIRIEDLCSDHPELLDEVRSQIRAIEAINPVLGLGTDDPGRRPPGPPQRAGFAAGSILANKYRIIAEHGRGGMGVVYRARDLTNKAVVALKALQWNSLFDPSAISRFKREFRALMDVNHTNLVSLYELFDEGPYWFFTMEFVEGTNLLAYVWAEVGPQVAGAAEDPPLPSPRPGGVQPERERPWHSGLSPPQLDRLRDVLHQLAQGVEALHRADKLHRDIKPTNVLVDLHGRVRLMDFGLVAELERGGLYQSFESRPLGTAAYMSPEQARVDPVSPASDWYSVGSLLFEALTGQPPFRGEFLDVLLSKRGVSEEPPDPRDFVAGIPGDLAELCVDLLRWDPAMRPQGRDVLRRLGGAVRQSGDPTPAPSRRSSLAPLIGRERHLEELKAAFTVMTRGRTVTLYVHGESGVGKSALIRQFLDDLIEHRKAVVLEGRCYERESVPYKALDQLIDNLSKYLERLPQDRVLALMPRDVSSLTMLFPVLHHVAAVAMAPRRDEEGITDRQELRRRAITALRELFGRLGDRERLVLSIDDLQWGDVDSAALLAELLQSPQPPRLLLLACYRRADESTSPFLQKWRSASEASCADLERRELAVDPLIPSEAENLALQLLDRDDPSSRAYAEVIALESGGNPFFARQLVQFLQSATDRTGLTPSTGMIALDEVIWEQVLRLPEPAQRLLEVVAVSGGPLGQTEALRSAMVEGDTWQVLTSLRAGRFIRVRDAKESSEIETYHDRVREAIIARLPQETLRGHHRRLALTLQASGRSDPEVLAVHFLGANDIGKAGEYYAKAATRAAESLAFDRAAMLYRRALELRPAGGVQTLREQLGDALANAGRGSEAAQAYLEAASDTHDATALGLRRRAAQQFLISGHVDDGLAALRDVLSTVGMRLPATPRGALRSLLLRSAELRLRGLRFRLREACQVARKDLERIDICWSVAVGLSLIDIVRGADFQRRGLLLALRAGEPFRIARALAFEAAEVSVSGRSSVRRATQLLQTAERVSQRVNNPYVVGLLSAVKGIAAFVQGSWKRAHELSDEAATIFRKQCTGVAWELDSMQNFALWSLTYLGEVAELSRRRPALLKEAQSRGDRYAVTNLSTSHTMAVVRLAADDPEGARDELKAIGQWSQKGFHLQHHIALLARVLIDLYLGEGWAAWSHVSEEWPGYSASLLFRVQQIHIDVLQLRGRSALAAAMTASDPKRLLRAAEADARRLERKNVSWATAHAQFLRAGVAAGQGDLPSAVNLLTAASQSFDAADMHLYAAVTRRRLGQLLGGDGGRVLVEEANSWMTKQTIRNPARMTAMYAPGFPD